MPIVRRHTLLVKTERGFFMSNSLNGRKVAVIGCGFVGSTTAYSLMQSKLFTDMVLIDADTNRAEGEALDISHGIPYYSPMNIYAGTYEDLSDASIVIITAGANQKPGETRLDLVQKNVAIFKTIVPRIMEQGFDGIFLVVSNPVDILTQVVMELSGLPRERVMGSGTVLDSARLKYTLGHMLDVDPRHVPLVLLASMETASWRYGALQTFPESASTISSACAASKTPPKSAHLSKKACATAPTRSLKRSAPRILASLLP